MSPGGIGRPSYLDTNALLRWAQWKTGTFELRDQSAANFILPLLTGTDASAVAISEITLIEFYDNVTHWYRSGNPGADLAWHASVDSELMAALAAGHVEVLTPEYKLFEKAMRYVRMSGIPEQRKFRAMDAAHLVQAVGWARRKREKVDLVSNDPDFTKLIGRFPSFSLFVTQVDPVTGQDQTRR